MSTDGMTEDNGIQFFQQIMNTAIRLPGVKINRKTFLNRELQKYCPKVQVQRAIESNPAQARISRDIIDKIANNCITYETTKVTAISAAAGIPGGLTMAGTVPIDLAQYFGHILRILQKLVYLYGWQDLLGAETEDLDDETTNLLTLFVGIMFGAQGATKIIASISKTAAANVEKRLMNSALTKGAVYPVVKKTMAFIGIKINKEIFSKSVSKAVPIIGGVVSGGITFGSFRPMAKKLQNYLKELPVCSVQYYRDLEKQKRPEEIPAVDVDYQEL